ncbi:hypothetical protein AVEN_90570-1 [Araneus ventricosus]|uniref:Uncharacterized protein n=1 Tax=Araneus ventricosus TaxID=182803 RepID=A0A4Y2WQB4_ARAVE|nr:hypothetical protein AVEN_90570-1 [Araneus ventricosus]
MQAIGDERADQTGKRRNNMGNPIHIPKLTNAHIRPPRKIELEEWQTLWKNGDTGRKIFNIMPSVESRPSNWIQRGCYFSLKHGPFPYLKRFHLSDSDYCSCGELERHFTMHGVYSIKCLVHMDSQP